MNHRKKWHETISDFRKQASLPPRGINQEWKKLEMSACTHFENPLKRFKIKTKLLNKNSMQQQKNATLTSRPKFIAASVICASMNVSYSSIYH